MGPAPFHITLSFDPILISKISLNGALNSLHSLTFSPNKVLLYILCLQEQSLIVSTRSWTFKRVLMYVEHVFFFFPKYFLNGFFLWWKKVQERESYLFKKKKGFPHNHHASDCNSKDTVLCFQQRNSSQLFTLTPVCQCIVHVYSIEYINIY